jgi:hypothetical protein
MLLGTSRVPVGHSVPPAGATGILNIPESISANTASSDSPMPVSALLPEATLSANRRTNSQRLFEQVTKLDATVFSIDRQTEWFPLVRLRNLHQWKVSELKTPAQWNAATELFNADRNLTGSKAKRPSALKKALEDLERVVTSRIRIDNYKSLSITCG